MNLFAPAVGGHPLFLDDLVLLQNAYAEVFSGLVGYLSPTGNTIITGVNINTTGPTVTYTAGFVAIAGEIFKVQAGAFTNSFNPADQLYFLPVQTVLPPSPDTYEDQSLKNVHFQRQVILKYFDSSTDSGGAFYPATCRADAGEIRDWVPPAGTSVSDFFDNTGLGIGVKLGWGLCNGVDGRPDLRGLTTACATNVPNSGAPALNGILSGLTNSIGDTQGINLKPILQANLPNVNLPVAETAHSHFNGIADDKAPGDGQNVFVYGETTLDMPGHANGQLANGSGGSTWQGITQAVTTGITVRTGGVGTGLEVRQPTYYLYKIIKLN